MVGTEHLNSVRRRAIDLGAVAVNSQNAPKPKIDVTVPRRQIVGKRAKLEEELSSALQEIGDFASKMKSRIQNEAEHSD